MVMSCCAVNCKQYYLKGSRVTFHCFPLNEERRKKWLKNVRRKNFVPGKYTKICSKHFEESCFDREKFGGHWLKATAVPTIFDHEPYYSANGEIYKPKVAKAKVSAVNGRQKSVPDGNEGGVSSITYPTSTSAKDYRHFGDFAAEDMNSLAKKKPVLQMEKTQAAKNKTWRRKELKTDEDEVIEYIEELEARKRASQCAVCSRSVINGKKECLGMLTSTSGLSLLQCLIGISGNNSTKIKECSTKDVVCVYCAHLINYADKLEAELGKLKAAINGCLQIKSLSEEDQEMLKPQFNSHISILDEFSDRVVGPGSAAGRGTEKDKDPDSGVSDIVIQEVISVTDLQEPIHVKENLVNSEREAPIQRNVTNIPGPVVVNANIVNSLWRNSMKTNVEKVRAHKPESSDRLKVDHPELVCKICNLRTSSRAVLFYHLRRHMANYQWCDFCDAPIYDDENETKKRKISVDPT
ncbi:uncharacterized protein LOC124157189 isoform X1 [Ischnura elegans]|uniref:uncharacterized protein LOC124157189 isoform X1 n=1 Tax=Ischnura elegans TaxID=197161 RepID=UPI001ED86F09|nr:uncharacterized protein LOC124157189 isoform X1 [Ischnura elegans]XP_046387683.1 uncharacterized protein LOC124157189 isoform X1 [Ischnura elegans]